MILPETPTDIAQAIQLALTPVFLLTGIAGLLNVMAGRLARIIDRARAFEHEWPQLDAAARAAAHAEMADLEPRRRLTSWAIGSCTFAALLVCLVVATLFVEGMLELPLKWFAGLAFVAAMLALTAGLTAFLAEIYIATRTVRILTARMGR
jgi:hypothetical protein